MRCLEEYSRESYVIKMLFELNAIPYHTMWLIFLQKCGIIIVVIFYDYKYSCEK